MQYGCFCPAGHWMIRGVVLHENGPVTIQQNPLQVWRIQWPFLFFWSGFKTQLLHGITTSSLSYYHTPRHVFRRQKNGKSRTFSRTLQLPSWRWLTNCRTLTQTTNAHINIRQENCRMYRKKKPRKNLAVHLMLRYKGRVTWYKETCGLLRFLT